VIPLFHFALKPGGFLFLGNAENVSRHTNLFAPAANGSRIFRRLKTSTRILPEFPLSAADRRPAEAVPARPRARAADAALALRAERIAQRYAPAFVVTDESFNVLHFSGKTGRYLEPSGGTASLNLLNLAHPDLRIDLRVALTRAAEQNATVQVPNVPMDAHDQRWLVDLVVEPVQGEADEPRSFVVLFKDGTALPLGSETAAADSPLLSQERIRQLETELRSANERLQATVEELESTNDELKSSNEEYQSLNEELQSANEELETSKEELQSVNEELTTVNAELAHRVQELGRANSDLKNLLESTQIATVFLDNDLRVTNFTPAAGEVFYLVETDIGRPIGHIKPRIAYKELQEDVQRVLRTLSSVDREVGNPATGARYMVRVLPYRSVDNYIGGAVITFTDVTPLTRAQEALRASESQARFLLAELQHRVRNTLSVIRSIARRTAETSDTVEDYAMHLEGRINAFARVQSAVTRNPASGLDLEMLVAEELLAHGAHEGQRVRSIKGPKLHLQPRAAETIGLAIHELATNAVKYGALSSERGRIQVDWAIEKRGGQEHLVFHWRETGVRTPGTRPARRGFGIEMIERTLAYELGGEAKLEFGADGLHCSIVLPVNDQLLAAN
jgi:two-component system CheB/CheR fusion protein